MSHELWEGCSCTRALESRDRFMVLDWLGWFIVSVAVRCKVKQVCQPRCSSESATSPSALVQSGEAHTIVCPFCMFTLDASPICFKLVSKFWVGACSVLYGNGTWHGNFSIIGAGRGGYWRLCIWACGILYLLLFIRAPCGTSKAESGYLYTKPVNKKWSEINSFLLTKSADSHC